jgi:hypothetical protein
MCTKKSKQERKEKHEETFRNNVEIGVVLAKAHIIFFYMGCAMYDIKKLLIFLWRYETITETISTT